MKLIIQIPCFNEEHTLPLTFNDLPEAIEGIDEIETLIINDGSTDRTVEVAQGLGVDHIVQIERNKGLANAFRSGLEASLRLGADIIVNTDGDNQYRGEDIARLVAPILRGEADIVIGDRQTHTIEHFSALKKLLQRVGSWVVRRVSNTTVPDATSGFRAYSREAAMRMVITSNYTYTLESIIQAAKKNLDITSVPIRTNEKLRESRLISSIPRYVLNSAGTILRLFFMYDALSLFTTISVILFAGGLILALRYLYFIFTGEGAGHVQSVILSAVLFIFAVQSAFSGVLANMLMANRHLNEEILYRLRKQELDR